MTPNPTSRTSNVALALIVAACGGGALLAALPFIGPFGGSWSGGVQGSNFWDDEAGETLDFDGFTDYFASPQAIKTATLVSAFAGCGDATNGLQLSVAFDGPEMSFSVPGNAARANCLRGRFLDEITMRLDIGASGKLFRNELELDPTLELGIWVDLADNNRRLVFKGLAQAQGGGRFTQSGCEYRGAGQTGSIAVSFLGSDVQIGVLPLFESVVITRPGGSETLSNGRLIGASGMRFPVAGGAVEFERRQGSLAC